MSHNWLHTLDCKVSNKSKNKTRGQWCAQGKPPVNFPEFKYDTEAIQQVPDWAAFVEQCRKEAEKASKAVQHSKYASMTQKLCQSSANICICCMCILPCLCKYVQTLLHQDLAVWTILTIPIGLVVVIVATELMACWRS